MWREVQPRSRARAVLQAARESLINHPGEGDRGLCSAPDWLGAGNCERVHPG